MSIVAHSTTEQSRIPSGRKVELGTALTSQLSLRASWQDRKWEYPIAPRDGGVVEILHGCEIADPYRSLEILEEESTQMYIREQNQLSQPLLHSHPLRKELEAAVEQSYAYERTSCPMLQGDGNYYWLYNPGTSPRDVLVKSRDLINDFGSTPLPISNGNGPEVVFDPNEEQDISLYMYSWSPSGRFWTAILQKAGSDWQNIRTIDTTTGFAVEEDLTGAKFTFGATWVYDTGFIYKATISETNGSAYSSMDGAFGMFYHRLNSPQSEDVLVWHGEGDDATSQIVGRPHVMSAKETDPTRRSWMLWDVYRNTNPETECFVIETPADSHDMGLRLQKAIEGGKRWLTRDWTGQTTYIGTLSTNVHLFFSTTDGIEAGRVLSLDGTSWDEQPDLSLKVVVPEHKDCLILQSAHLVNDQLLTLVYLLDACAEIVFADARTGESIGKTDARGTRGHATADPIELPVPHEELDAQRTGQDPVVIPKHASISAVSCRSDSDEMFLAIDTYLVPPYVLTGKVYNDPKHGVDVHIGRLDHENAPHEDLVCREVMYTSHDGVKVPLFINHAKDLDMSIPQPVLLHAYGGSGVCLTPHYNPLFASFMRNLRGIVAVACIRGGGEYGKAWHDVAVGINRTISFDDMAYAARFLHTSGLSTPSLTSIYGISNGGLLVAACANRNPELYGVVFCDVGVLDLTRFHKFTLGRLWTAEYGDPDNVDHLPIILASSPYHNIQSDVGYPAILVTTGDHDTRVIPGHSLKYIAQLQNILPKNRNIFLARIYENAGHESASKSVAQRVEEAVDRLVFILSTISRS